MARIGDNPSTAHILATALAQPAPITRTAPASGAVRPYPDRAGRHIQLMQASRIMPSPAHSDDRGDSWRQAAPLGGGQRHQAADSQLPGPGGQRKKPTKAPQYEATSDNPKETVATSARTTRYGRWERGGSRLYCAGAPAGSATRCRGSWVATPDRTAPRHPATSNAGTARRRQDVGGVVDLAEMKQ